MGKLVQWMLGKLVRGKLLTCCGLATNLSFTGLVSDTMGQWGSRQLDTDLLRGKWCNRFWS